MKKCLIMIDTVKIRLDKSWFTIVETARFSSQIKAIQNERDIPKPGSPYVATRNATKAEKELHGYMPQITVRKSLNQGLHHYADIQFSVPKIVFGNNFDEVTEEHLDYMSKELDKKLKLMGLRVHGGYARIRKAAVRSIHYGKNIILEHYTVGEYLRMLQQCKLSKDKHTGFTHYQNGGTQFRYGTKQKGFTAYDKLKDLEYAQKRGQGYKTYEDDYYCQTSLFDEREPQSNEVLRFEKRLNGRNNVFYTLKKLGVVKERDELILQDLFSKDIAKKVLLAELEFHKQSHLAEMAFTESDELKRTQELIALNPEAQLKDIHAAMHLSKLLERYDYRSVASMYSKYLRKFSYLMKCYRQIKKPDGSHADILDFIEQQLEEFIQLSIKSITIMIDNDI